MTKWLSLITVCLVFGLVSCSVQTPKNDDNFTTYGLGVIPGDPVELEEHLITKRTGYKAPSAALPVSVDNSETMPPVGNQGSLGSCTAWATTYAAKTHEGYMQKNWNISTKNYQFSPAYVYNQLNGGGTGGISIASALNLLKNQGCDFLFYFSYSASDWTTQPNAESRGRASNYKTADWATLPRDVATIKGYIAQNKAVIIEVPIYDQFNNIGDGVYNNFTGTLRGYHAICLTGYDDNRQAFKFQNSWGANWGTWRNPTNTTKGKGYGWITYGVVNANFYYNSYIMNEATYIVSSASSSKFSSFSSVSSKSSFSSISSKSSISSVIKSSVSSVVKSSSSSFSSSSVSSTPVVGVVSVHYSIDNDWGTGATINVTLKNNGNTPIDGWNIKWTFTGNQTITQMWNATFSQTGNAVTADNLNYNNIIPAHGGTVTFGMNVNYSGANALPTGVKVNGYGCAFY